MIETVSAKIIAGLGGMVTGGIVGLGGLILGDKSGFVGYMVPGFFTFLIGTVGVTGCILTGGWIGQSLIQVPSFQHKKKIAGLYLSETLKEDIPLQTKSNLSVFTGSKSVERLSEYKEL